MSSFVRPAPGDREQLVDPASGLRLEGVAFYTALLDHTSRVVIDEIRRYFQINPMAGRYRWRGVVRDNGQIETDLDTKIHVAVAHPDQDRKWPYIVLKGIGGGMQDLWLGQKGQDIVAANPNYSRFDAVQAKRDGVDYDEPEQLEVGIQLYGKSQLTVQLEVGTVGTGPTTECNVVTDLLLMGLAVPIRREWSKRGIEWIPNTNTISPEEVAPLQGQQERSKEAKRTIGFGLWTSWHKDFYWTAPIVDEILIQRSYLSGTEPPLPTP